MELGTSIATGLGPQPHAHPPRHLTPTATCELEQEKMRFMARARATGGTGTRGELGHRFPNPRDLAGCGCSRELSKAERDPPGTRPGTRPTQSEARTRSLGLRLRPWPCPSPPRRRQKGCGLCDLAVFSNRAGPQLGMAQSQKEPCASGPASPHHALGPGLRPFSQPRLGQASFTPSPR